MEWWKELNSPVPNALWIQPAAQCPGEPRGHTAQDARCGEDIFRLKLVLKQKVGMSTREGTREAETEEEGIWLSETPMRSILPAGLGGV